ncbi:hypothetical protein H5410_040589 [Solanum commersonii]|uniref:Uncharacterized protein n=1 Tax=Solanum commersonii TaxID=4109 RepID=A0A9J5XP93_SOLCO|nr:hypothetical protein H5410_040589 [Solanum commersonii]
MISLKEHNYNSSYSIPFSKKKFVTVEKSKVATSSLELQLFFKSCNSSSEVATCHIPYKTKDKTFVGKEVEIFKND